MATRGWAASVAFATSIAAAVAAAQLGLGYGLAVLHWTGDTGPAGQAAWLASLSWAFWIAATATVVGAVAADRLAGGGRGYPPPRRVPAGSRPARSALRTSAWRLTLAVAAAIGGLLTVPLVAVPARATLRPVSPSPQLVAGGYALLGVAAGLLLAVAALAARAVAINLSATAVWVGGLAVGALVVGAAGQGRSTVPLATWRFGHGPVLHQSVTVFGAALSLAAALVLGMAAAWPAARRGDSRVGAAVSGVAGPGLVAAAYFLAAPSLSGAGEQVSAFLVAPYAVTAGLAGSMLVVALTGRRSTRPVQRAVGTSPVLSAGRSPMAGDPPALPQAASRIV